MYRTHNCGELRISDLGKQVTLSGWVQKSRDKGFIVWVDLRDRYGITQLVFDEERTSKDLIEQAQNLGREFVIQVTGTVVERSSKNKQIPTGEIFSAKLCQENSKALMTNPNKALSDWLLRKVLQLKEVDWSEKRLYCKLKLWQLDVAFDFRESTHSLS